MLGDGGAKLHRQSIMPVLVVYGVHMCVNLPEHCVHTSIDIDWERVPGGPW